MTSEPIFERIPDSLIDPEKTFIKELHKLYLWRNVNRLSLNIDKTNYIIFYPFNKPSKLNATININKKAINENRGCQIIGKYTKQHQRHKRQKIF